MTTEPEDLNWNDMLKSIVTTGLGHIPYAGSMISALVGVLWPDHEPDLWKQIRNETEQLIDQKLGDLVHAEVTNELMGLHNVIHDYQKAIATADKDYIAARWHTAAGIFRKATPVFQHSEYSVLLLPLFAQYGNLHLALLRDGYQIGAQWGFSPEAVADVGSQLRTLCHEYTAYAHQTFGLGVQYEADRTPVDYHAIEPFRATNRYRRETILTVMDFAETWQFFDAVTYPNPLPANKLWLYREIMSDPFGTADDSGLFTPPIYQPMKPMDRISVWGDTRIDSLQMLYQSGYGPNGGDLTPRMGASGGSEQPPRGGIFDVSTKRVRSVTVRAGDVVEGLAFTFADGTVSHLMGGSGGSATTVAYAGHTLSSIYVNGVSRRYNCADSIVFGFMLDAVAPKAETYRTLFVTTPAEITLEGLLETVPEEQRHELLTRAAQERWHEQRRDHLAMLLGPAPSEGEDEDD